MPSMLALPPSAADLGFNQYPREYSSCREQRQGMLYAGSKGLRDLSGGGLPTPPTTADMAALSIPSNTVNYQPQHPYLTEQRPLSTSDMEYRAGHVANGKAAAGPYDLRAPSNHSSYQPNGVRAQENPIASHLQIPESVNSSKGSLAEFAANITCLFWFETSATIEYAENLPTTVMPDRGLTTYAMPVIGFTKWVTTLLSTTQVGKNVVLLALMFIHRLKKFNAGVSGKPGSEYRLLTIALMLGNKFLDDNTYTNKTWAEVSGISVREIHIMEVEFLSNMRYELYASGGQWQEWKSKLGRLGSFYEKAFKLTSAKDSPTTPLTQAIPHKLPSPPTGHRSNNGSYSQLPNPMHTLPQLQRSPARHIPAMDFPLSRKRSLDTSIDVPPAKRVHSSMSTNMSPSVYTPSSALIPSSMSTALSYDSSRLPQLPLPNLPNPVSNNVPHLTPLSLPGPRSMSAVYQNAAGYPQPLTPMTAGAPNMPYPQMPGMGNGSRAPSQAGSTQTSPTNMYGSSTPTRPGLSPSYFLMNRSSPYRPVRNVNTLLYPPPSAAMQNSVKPIDYQQMHYQPLSKHSNQLHPGPMPSLQPDVWQGHVSTPTSQVYRPY